MKARVQVDSAAFVPAGKVRVAGAVAMASAGVEVEVGADAEAKAIVRATVEEASGTMVDTWAAEAAIDTEVEAIAADAAVKAKVSTMVVYILQVLASDVAVLFASATARTTAEQGLEDKAAGMVKAAEELSTIVFELVKELVFVGEPGAGEAAVVATVFAKAELEVEEAVPGAAR